MGSHSLTLRKKKGESPFGSLQELSELLLEGGQLHPRAYHLVGDRVLRAADVT